MDPTTNNRPQGSHYRQGTIQPIEYINANNLNFDEGNAVKYITRHRYKNGKQDILKAIDYCTYILQHQYGMSLFAIGQHIEDMLATHEPTPETDDVNQE